MFASRRCLLFTYAIRMHVYFLLRSTNEHARTAGSRTTTNLMAWRTSSRTPTPLWRRLWLPWLTRTWYLSRDLRPSSVSRHGLSLLVSLLFGCWCSDNSDSTCIRSGLKLMQIYYLKYSRRNFSFFCSVLPLFASFTEGGKFILWPWVYSWRVSSCETTNQSISRRQRLISGAHMHHRE